MLHFFVLSEAITDIQVFPKDLKGLNECGKFLEARKERGILSSPCSLSFSLFYLFLSKYKFSSKDNLDCCLQPFVTSVRARDRRCVHSRRNYCQFMSAPVVTPPVSPALVAFHSSNRTDKLPTNHRSPLIYQSVKTFVQRKFYCE